MEKFKVLRIIARLNIGGPAIHTILLTEGLDKNRFESILVAGSVARREGDMLYYAHKKNIPVRFLPELKREINPIKDWIAFLKILRIVESEKPKIIHTHTAKAGTLGRLAGVCHNFLNPFKDRKVILIHTFHGHIFSGYFSKITTKIFIWTESFLALFTSRIITVSNTLRDKLVNLRICNQDKISVIPLGFDLEDFLDIPYKNTDILNIGIIGRLVPIKNHRLFLGAASMVLHLMPHLNLRFKIIGDGELRKDLEEYSASLGISSSVDFLGWQKDLVKVYSGLDLVILSSLNEGTPVSLIEAMASGRPVIATDVGGVRDLLGLNLEGEQIPKGTFKILERGILIKSNDHDSLVKALAFIIENRSLRYNMCVSARAFVKTSFRKERLVRDIENLYLSILRV